MSRADTLLEHAEHVLAYLGESYCTAGDARLIIALVVERIGLIEADAELPRENPF